MSWTIETKHADRQDMRSLKKAIDLAEEENIVMFCSASDQGSSSSEDCYPGKWNKCIKIGAATGTGERCAWVPSDASRLIDFLLPGENIAFSTANDKPPTFESGSSVATALASGLGALLLYCDRLITLGPQDSDDQGEKVEALEGSTKVRQHGRMEERKIEPLREKARMEKAFKTMSKGSSVSFLQVQEFFDSRFVDMKWDFDSLPDESRKAKKALSSMMERIKGR